MYLRPSAAHLAARPVDASSVCTSPWPCGLVSISYGEASDTAMCASLSVSAATFSCFMNTTCPGARP